jgi:hypothetical protein
VAAEVVELADTTQVIPIITGALGQHVTMMIKSARESATEIRRLIM